MGSTGSGTAGHRVHRRICKRRLSGDKAPDPEPGIAAARSTDDEKASQLSRLNDFHTRHAAQAPAMLKRLQQAVMDAVRVCSLGQITGALFEVGGQYRRSM
jgi:isobutyryl-CoA mutase